MLAQVDEELPVLDQTLVQPGKLLGLETAVGCEISGVSHPPKSIGGLCDRNRFHPPDVLPGLIALDRWVATASYSGYAVSMKISVSLPEEDVEFLDKYAESEGYGSRSAVVHTAVRMLRSSKLGGAYADAWSEWADSGESEVWDSAVGDGLS